LGIDYSQEGKFRPVRKMTAAVGFPLRLVRVRIEIHLNDLQAGEVKVEIFK
jgi:23S rRNA pseudouridine2457 synthase